MARGALRSACFLALAVGVCLAGITVKVTPVVNVTKGETARLPCSYTTPDSSSLLVVRWFIEESGSRKSVAFRSSTESGVNRDTQFTGRATIEADMTLVISNTMVQDERSFFCQVSGAVGQKEEETKLMVYLRPQKPMVSGNDKEIFVIQDNKESSQVATCTSMNGHPQPRIIWFKDATPLPESTDSTLETYMVPQLVKESSGLFTVASTLFMRLKKEDAKAVFHCIVEYQVPNEPPQNMRSDDFGISLHYPSENVFFTLLHQSPIKEGDNVQMNCKTDGNPQPQFEYHYGNKPLQGNEGLLTLMNITRNDAGIYRCDALDFDADDLSQLTKSLDISVHYLDPVSIVPAGPLTVMKEEAVEVQCKTKSADKYTLEWKKGGKVLSQSGVLTMEAITMTSAGDYVCEASVPSVPGLTKRSHITIRVKGKPEIEAPMKSEVDKQGDMVTLKCSALGYPAPQFTWKPSGKESVSVEGQKTISTITLQATAEVIDQGVICEAFNSDGLDSKKFMVEVKSGNTAEFGNKGQAESQQGGSSGVVIAVVVCVLLLLLLVASLYFLSKRGVVSCGEKGKKDVETGGVKNQSEEKMNPVNPSKTSENNEEMSPLKQLQ